MPSPVVIKLYAITPYMNNDKMEGQVATALGMLPKVIGMVPQVVGGVSKLFGDGSFKDTPSVVTSGRGNFNVTDLPVEVAFNALSSKDFVGDQSAVIESETASKCENLLYRLMIPARVNTIVWDITNSTGVLLASYTVHPGECEASGTAPITAVNTPMSYLQAVYQLWRGGIRFTFECLPSHFHQGQLFIAFNPTPDDITLEQAVNCTSATIDLGVKNRTSLDVPFVSRFDYLKTTDSIGLPPTSLESSVGRVHMFVQNPLVNNGTVASSIDINVYMSALDDFELKVPSQLSGSRTFAYEGVYQCGGVRHCNVEGVLQMEEEVVRDVAVDVPVHVPQQGLVDKTLENVVDVANVVSADTMNIMERQYLLTTAQHFNVTDIQGTQLYQALLPDAFWLNKLAPRGLYNYHEFFRMGFKITLRINPTQFHQGALMMVWMPELVNVAGRSFNSYTQLPHVIMNVATETSMDLIVPYSHFAKIMRTGVGMGAVRVYVWNVLRAPTAAAQVLNFSIWIQALNPHVAVKRAYLGTLDGVLQGTREPSDTITGGVTNQVAFKRAGINGKGHIPTDHMNVLSLLRRPCFVSSSLNLDWATNPPASADVNITWRFPAMCGRTHIYLASSYLYASGANRIHFTTNIARALNATFIAFCDFDVDVKPLVTVPILVSPPVVNMDRVMRGATQWAPAEEPEKIIEIPHYRRGPMQLMHTPNVAGGGEVYFPQLEFAIVPDSTVNTTTGLRIWSFHSVSDDFHVYFPLSVPNVQYTPTAAEFRAAGKPVPDEVNDIEQRLLRAGIEPNPGPELASESGLFSLVMRLNDSIAGAIRRSVKDTEGVLQIGEILSEKTATLISDKVLAAAQPTMESFQQCCESFRSLAGVTQAKVDGIEAAAKSFVSVGAEKVGPLVQSGLDRIYTFITNVRDILHAVLSLGCNRIVQVLGVWKLIDLFCKWGADSVLVQQLEKLARKVGVLQSDEWMSFLSENCVSMAGAVVTVILGLTGHRSSKSTKQMFMHYVRETSANQGPLGRVSTFVTAVIDYIWEGTGMLEEFVQSTGPEQVSFTTMYNSLRKSSDWGKLKAVQPLVQKAERFKKLAASGARFDPLFSRNVQEVIEHNAKLCAEDRVPQRMAPVCWFLYGKSRQGKSYLQQHILPALFLKRIGKITRLDEALAETYAIPMVDVKHWEGYSGHLVSNIDDAFTVQGSDDPSRIINLITPVDFTVPKASMEGKKDKFVSIGVGVSSNCINFSSLTQINNPKALANRLMENAVEVEKKAGDLLPEVKDISNLDELYAFCDRHWTLKRLRLTGADSITVSAERPVITMKEFIDNLAVTYTKLSSERDVFHECFKQMQGSTNGDVYEEADTGCTKCGTLCCSGCNGERVLFSNYTYSDAVAGVMRCEKLLSGTRSRAPSPSAGIRAYFPTTSTHEVDLVVAALEHDLEEGIVDMNKTVLIQMARIALEDAEPIYGHSLEDALKERSIRKIFGALVPKTTEEKLPIWKGVAKWAAILGIVGSGLLLLKYAWSALRGLLTGVLQGTMYDGAAIRRHMPAKGVVQDVGVKEKIRRTVRWVELYHLDDPAYGIHGMHCIMLEGRYALVPNHLYEHYVRYNKNTVERVVGARIRLAEAWYPFIIDATNSVRVKCADENENVDLRVVYLLGAPIAGCPHILHFIPTAREVQNLIGTEMGCDILTPNVSDRVDVPVIVTTREMARLENNEFLIAKIGEIDTQGGDCGRPYVCREARIKSPLIAIHGARFFRSKTCGATQLVREEIEVALTALKKLIQFPVCHVNDEVGDLECNGEVPKGWIPGVEVLGETKWCGIDVLVHVPTKTDKRRWLNHPKWSDSFRPSAKGTVGDVRTLETNVSQKYTPKPTGCITSQTFLKCVKFYTQKIPKLDEVWSESDSINGRGSMMPLQMNTSCGYWSKYFANGKKEFFDQTISATGSVYSWSSKALTWKIPEVGLTFVDHLRDCDRKLEIGVKPLFMWVSTNKDELRPIEKVEAGKTRVFEQPPLELSLLLRKYFGPFLNFIKDSPGFLTHSAIGIDKEVVWGAMWEALRSKSDVGFDIDYSNYDGSVPCISYDFFRAVTDVCMPESTKVQRHVLLDAMQYSTLVCRRTVFRTTQGNKSGSPLTDVFNGVTNSFMLLLSYLNACQLRGQPTTFDNFHRDVRMITYGDDVICSVAKPCTDYFNREYVAQVASKFGMKVTSAAKTGALLPYEKLSNLSFIKLSFREEGGLVMCPLPLEVIWRVVQWTDKNNVGDGIALRAIAGVAVRMMAHHGREKLETFLAQLSEAGMPMEFDYEMFRVDLLALQDGYEFPVG